ncbi:MAG: glucuronate isomerase [Oscillospiraceae bacterium]|nr:glucuronate isomerase [Oscillospiraceae bacterium]
MLGDIADDRLKAGNRLPPCARAVSLPDHAAKRQQQVPHAQPDLHVAAEAVGVQLLENGKKLAAQAVEFQRIRREHILLPPARAVEQKKVIRQLGAQRLAKALAEPEDETAVGRVPAADDGAVGGAGRHEYFRRILCELLGSWVENGEFPNDEKALRAIVEGVCFRNAERYFDL